jgi:anionic cell wall polymer biosynthesis LytR-Cps2A-Psr (LCP) family protein
LHSKEFPDIRQTQLLNMSKLNRGTDQNNLLKTLSQDAAKFGSFHKYSGIIGFEAFASRQTNLQRRQILKASKAMISAELHPSNPPLLITKVNSTKPAVEMAAPE